MLAGITLVLFLVTLPSLLEITFLTLGAILKQFKRTTTQNIRKIQPRSTVVIIPAYNEEKGIQHTIHALKACTGCFEIVVVADNCTDKTASKAEHLGVRVLKRDDPQKIGKDKALQYAFEKLLQEDFDYFIILDADSIPSKNFVEEIQSAFAEGSDAVQVAYRILNLKSSLRARLFNIAFLAFNHVRGLGRSFWKVSTGIYGNGMAFSREILLEIPFTLDSIVEDLAYHLQLIEKKKKVKYVDSATVWAEVPSSIKALSAQRTRWEGGRLKTAFRYLPSLLKEILKGNGRFIEPCLDLLTLPLSALVFCLVLLALLPYSLTHDFAVIGGILVICHITTGMILGNCSWKDYLSLAIAPLYLIWKAFLVMSTIKAAIKSTVWKRTPRHGET